MPLSNMIVAVPSSAGTNERPTMRTRDVGNQSVGATDSNAKPPRPVSRSGAVTGSQPAASNSSAPATRLGRLRIRRQRVRVARVVLADDLQIIDVDVGGRGRRDHDVLVGDGALARGDLHHVRIILR